MQMRRTCPETQIAIHYIENSDLMPDGTYMRLSDGPDEFVCWYIGTDTSWEVVKDVIAYTLESAYNTRNEDE